MDECACSCSGEPSRRGLQLWAAADSDAPTGPIGRRQCRRRRTVTSVAVTGPSSFSQRGQTQQMVARVTLSNGFVEDRSSTATWQSDNTGVANVSSSGLVTIGNEGEATISATLEGQRGTLARPGRPRLPDGRSATRTASAEAERVRCRPSALCRERPISSRDPASQRTGGTGTWEFMDVLVDRLRLRDTRWGYPRPAGRPRRRRRATRSPTTGDPGQTRAAATTTRGTSWAATAARTRRRPGSMSATSGRSGCRAEGSRRSFFASQATTETRLHTARRPASRGIESRSTSRCTRAGRRTSRQKGSLTSRQ